MCYIKFALTSDMVVRKQVKWMQWMELSRVLLRAAATSKVDAQQTLTKIHH